MSKLPDLAGTLIGVLALSTVSAFQASNAWGQASDVICAGCVDTNDLANDAVTFPKLAADVAGAIPELTPIVLSVDCSIGQTIAGAIDSLPRGQVATIELIRNCTEDVTITRDDITLDGDPDNTGTKSTLTGTITIDNARRVVIQQIDVTGSGMGVVGTNGASFSVLESDVQQNDLSGIYISFGAHGVIDNNTVTNNDRVGIFVGFGATAHVTRNTIQSNFWGMFLSRGAYVNGGLNTVSGNRSTAVTVSNGSTYTDRVTLASGEPGRETIDASSNLAGDAFLIDHGSTVVLEEAIVTGAVKVSRLSQFQIFAGVTFNGRCIVSEVHGTPTYSLCP